jgi:hypothetical protein
MAISQSAELNGYQPEDILRQLAKGNYSSIFAGQSSASHHQAMSQGESFLLILGRSLTPPPH